jgi:sporulation protein YlmC with PRC-barrel domain
MAGRQYYLALQLLDRQLLDRNGRLVGKVDDLELSEAEGGKLLVTFILSGPGVLAQRMGARWGSWVRRVHALLLGGGADPARIPIGRVSAMGSHITLAAEQEDLATYTSERWVADRIIRRIPGGSHAPE